MYRVLLFMEKASKKERKKKKETNFPKFSKGTRMALLWY